MRLIATALIGMALLTGCASTETTAVSTPSVIFTPDPEPTYEPTPETARDDYSLTSETEMLTMIQSKDAYFLGQDETQILEVAHGMCQTLRSGTSVAEIGDIARETIGIDHASVLLAGAIIYLCPDQQSKIEE